MIGFVAIGAAITFVACLGCCGAQYRKSEGTEKRGFLMLVVYAFCMAVLLMVQIAFAVSIYVANFTFLDIGFSVQKMPEIANAFTHFNCSMPVFG